MTDFDPRAAARETFNEGRVNGDGPQAAPPPPIDAIDLRKAKEPGPREWRVDNWIPKGWASGLWGAGGGGKSTILQLLLTCCVIDHPWFGLKVDPGPALGFFTEDDQDELLRRQFVINKALGIEQVSDLAGKLCLIPRAGLPNTLAIDRGGLEMTPVFDALRKKIMEIKPKISGIDTLSQVYGADPVNANQITGFVNIWAGIARESNGAVLLVGHPGKAFGNEYAGPYAWDASVRALLFLEEDTGGVRKLTKRKANFATKDETIELEWRNGLYLPVDPARMTYGECLDAQLRRGEACQEFLDALERTARQGVNLSDSNRAANYAPKVMVDRRFANGFSILEMERAMLTLLDDGRIVANQPIGKYHTRHARYGLVKTSQDNQT
jgi:RecA-family ATPase